MKKKETGRKNGQEVEREEYPNVSAMGERKRERGNAAMGERERGNAAIGEKEGMPRWEREREREGIRGNDIEAMDLCEYSRR